MQHAHPVVTEKWAVGATNFVEGCLVPCGFGCQMLDDGVGVGVIGVGGMPVGWRGGSGSMLEQDRNSGLPAGVAAIEGTEQVVDN